MNMNKIARVVSNAARPRLAESEFTKNPLYRNPINVAVISVISKYKGIDSNTVATSILDNSAGEKPIHKAIDHLLIAIKSHADDEFKVDL